jgi:hypothetical protein
MEWDQCQQRFILDTTREEVMGEPQWIRAMMQETWKYQKTRWRIARNKTLRGKGTLLSQATKDALIARITALYGHEELLLVYLYKTVIHSTSPSKNGPQGFL